MTAPARQGIWQVARQGWRRELPERYRLPGAGGPELFARRVAGALAPGAVVVDVGAGAEPVVSPEQRPPGCTYVGLDVSAAELERAPRGSYDETVIADLAVPRAELAGRFDLAVSRFTLEHVPDLRQALSTIRGHLRPGGRLLAYLSGRNSVASALNRALPERVSASLLERLTGREPDSIHPARYDRCTDRELREVLADGWAEAEVIACYWGEKYFRFSRPLHAMYVVYEEIVSNADRRGLATHYLIDATRS